jgi:hypothetical protein
MSTQFSQSETQMTPGNRRPAGDLVRERPTERAFVVQFERIEGPRSRLRGRVELVASGEAIRFRSLKQLVDFMVRSLRKRAAAEPTSNA